MSLLLSCSAPTIGTKRALLIFVSNRIFQTGNYQLWPDAWAERRYTMLHIIWSIIVGFIVGLIARAVVPGAQHIGFIATTV